MNWGIFKAYTRGIERSLEFIALEEGFTNAVGSLRQAGDQASRTAVEQSFLNTTVVQRVHDHCTQHIFLNIATFVGIGEILWIFVMCAHSLRLWWLFCTDRSEYRAYRSIVFFFQRVLPQFSTFSAMKLMTRVHPSLLYHEFLNHTNETQWRATKLGRIVSATLFLLQQFSFGAAALCALAIKVLTVGLKLVDPEVSWVFRICSLLALMVQCMGSILMDQVLQERIFLLVFGGQDANYQDDEQAYKNVYNCRLAKQIWLEFSRIKAVVLLATLDHYDIQKMLIEADDIDLQSIFPRDQLQTSLSKGSLPLLYETASSIGDVEQTDAHDSQHEGPHDKFTQTDLPAGDSPKSSHSLVSLPSEASINSAGMRAVTRALCRAEPREKAKPEWAVGDVV
jgi:hypothetical protein